MDSVASDRHPERNEDDAFIDPDSQSMGGFDGVGGQYGSAEAAKIAVNISKSELAKIRTAQSSVPESLQLLKHVLRRADRAIAATGKGIATTGALVKYFKDGRGEPYAGIAAVADTRVLLMRAEELHFITFDAGFHFGNVPDDVRHLQAKLANVVKAAELTTEERIAFRHRNVINSAIGNDPHIVTCHVPLLPGDRFYILTDGSHDNSTFDEIANIIRDNPNDSVAITTLVKAALARSRSDHFRAKQDDITGTGSTYHASPRTWTVTEHNTGLDSER